jgi:hypothetical protein
VLARWHEAGGCPLDLHRLVPIPGTIRRGCAGGSALALGALGHDTEAAPGPGLEENGDRRLRRSARVIYAFLSAGPQRGARGRQAVSQSSACRPAVYLVSAWFSVRLTTTGNLDYRNTHRSVWASPSVLKRTSHRSRVGSDIPCIRRAQAGSSSSAARVVIMRRGSNPEPSVTL